MFVDVPASRILMLRPDAFGGNNETQDSNAFQKAVGSNKDVQDRARYEFDRLLDQIRGVGVSVDLVEDSPPAKPDAVFLNNWFISLPNIIVLCPMMAESRRFEIRPNLIQSWAKQFQIQDVIDLRECTDIGRFLEGTGSIVFDHQQDRAFACESPRTDPVLVEEIAEQIGYQPVVFEAVDFDGKEIYHTNVMMSVGKRLAFVCFDSILSPVKRSRVEELLRNPGRRVVPLTFEHIEAFGGNVLELSSEKGIGYVVSKKAMVFEDLAGVLREHSDWLIEADIPTIEEYGGGSVRCMIAENFWTPL